MTKILKRRFIVSTMTAVTLLLIVLLGIINITNYRFTDADSDRILNILSDPQAHFPPGKLPTSFPSREQRGNKVFSPPTSENARLSALHFTVITDKDGSNPEIDLSRISEISEEDATSLFKKALSEKNDTGKIDSFKYKKSTLPDGRIRYLFLDTTTQFHHVLRILAFSALAGLFVWIAMLLIVIFISNRAISPIAKNIEKQKQFVTDAGHEIKTPLAIILANTEALELHNGENKWSRNIKSQVVRLDGLMKDLLALSRSDEANINVPKADFDLSSLLCETVDMFKESAKQRSLTFDCKIPIQISVCSNKEHILRIISILLDNSVKYAKENSSINISLTQSGKATELSVKNECETLPTCKPEKLFDRFYREDNARTQKNGGYGIGLSAAQALATLCSGRLCAKYESGNFIVFTLEI